MLMSRKRRNQKHSAESPWLMGRNILGKFQDAVTSTAAKRFRKTNMKIDEKVKKLCHMTICWMRIVLEELKLFHLVYDDVVWSEAGEAKNQKRLKAWLRHYVFAFKVRRRALRQIGAVYGDCSPTPVKRLFVRVEEATGRLEKEISQRLLDLLGDDDVQPFVDSLWRDRPNPPAIIEKQQLVAGYWELFWKQCAPGYLP